MPASRSGKGRRGAVRRRPTARARPRAAMRRLNRQAAACAAPSPDAPPTARLHGRLPVGSARSATRQVPPHRDPPGAAGAHGAGRSPHCEDRHPVHRARPSAQARRAQPGHGSPAAAAACAALRPPAPPRRAVQTGRHGRCLTATGLCGRVRRSRRLHRAAVRSKRPGPWPGPRHAAAVRQGAAGRPATKADACRPKGVLHRRLRPPPAPLRPGAGWSRATASRG
jgi:hypothetical protein